jgi:hypothetical protein
MVNGTCEDYVLFASAAAERHHCQILIVRAGNRVMSSITTAHVAPVAAIAAALMLQGCGHSQRELSDDEWCRSFDYRPDSREYTECRARIDRQRQRGDRVSQ